MPDKQLRIARSRTPPVPAVRPVLLAIAGDSASGKTTLARGLVEAMGPQRCTSVCVDDYHRYDRAERARVPISALNPDANYVDIMEQHLQMLATGQPILKPVYDHRSGTFGRPEYIEPRQFIIIEGLLPLLTRLSRACFDISVFLDPPERLRRSWKLRRDTGQRGYSPAEAVADLERHERDSADFIRPQRRHADIVVRFTEPEHGPERPLSAELLLRPTIAHPPLSHVLTDDVRTAMNLTIIRDSDGTPVDCLQVHGHAEPEEIHLLQKAIWSGVADRREMPGGLGSLGPGERSEPLAVAQLLLLYHLVQEVYLS
jgi:phosphoribulokinase